MALPLLLGAAKGLLSNTTKSVVKKKAASTAKDFVTGKGKDKKKGGSLIKKGSSTESSTKAKVKPTQKYAGGVSSSGGPSGVPKAEVSSGGSNVSYEKLTQQLDNIIGLTSSLDKAFKGQYDQKKKESKKKDKEAQKAKREGREATLEGGSSRSGAIGGSILGAAKKFNIFNFLLNTLMGGLAVLFLKNFESIKSFFTEFGEAFNNKMNLLRWGLMALNKPISAATRTVAKVFTPLLKKVGGGLKKGITGIGKFVGKGLKKLGLGIFNFAKKMHQAVKTAATSGAKSAAKSASKSAAKSGTRVATNSATKSGLRSATNPSLAAIKKFGKSGATRLSKFSKGIRGIPLVGSLIAIGIDLAMGETLDRAIVGAIGGSLGFSIGAAIGTGLIPIPFLGTAIGGFVGAGLGDFFAKKLYSNFASNLIGQGLSPLGDSGITEEQMKQKLKEQQDATAEIMKDDPRMNPDAVTQANGTGPIDMGADVNAKLKKMAGYAMQAGFTKEQAKVMAAIAGGESTFDNTAHNNEGRDNSYGLWQINMRGPLGPERRKQFGISSNEQLFDPVTNAKAAKAIFDSGQGFNAWGAYKDGNAAKYMNAAKSLDLSGTTSAPQVTPINKPLTVPMDQIPGENAPQAEIDEYFRRLDAGELTGTQVSPTVSPTAQSSSVASRASYEGGGSQTVSVPYPVGGGQESPMMGGSSGGVTVMGGSTRSLVNSYYKSKLMGFLYKQG
tara:strand:+ start:5120 stop:7294 length:2175 start_codon:yes stop_codon:yes gene_type:complete